MVRIVPDYETIGCAQTIKISKTHLKIFCHISVASEVPAIFPFLFTEKTIMIRTFRRLIAIFSDLFTTVLQCLWKVEEYFLPCRSDIMLCLHRLKPTVGMPQDFAENCQGLSLSLADVRRCPCC